MGCGFTFSFDSLEMIKNYSEQVITNEISIELNKEGKIAFLLKDLIDYVQGLDY